jgi:uncharacterized protein (DUF697 family)
MPKLPDLANGLKMLREVDLNAVREQAEAPLHVVVIGDKGAGKSALIEQLLAGDRADEPPGIRPVSMHRPEGAPVLTENSLVLYVLDARKSEQQRDRQLVEQWIAAKIPVVVCYNKSDLAREELVENAGTPWPGAETAIITATDSDSLVRELVPSMLRACKGRDVQLARNLPLLRRSVAQKLIDDTSFINATYSLSTGIGEMVPVLNLPLNLADILVLTKNQALMAYKITLAMGLHSDWRDTVPKLAAVVGTAFLWRQLARTLVGLIPVIGIVPKIVISYAGTYAIGEAIYQWCANGEKLNPEALKSLYAEALERGGNVARLLMEKRDIAGARAAEKWQEIAQEVGERGLVVQEQASGGLRRATDFLADKSAAARDGIVSLIQQVSKPASTCPSCGKKTPRGAAFCPTCGKPLNT